MHSDLVTRSGNLRLADDYRISSRKRCELHAAPINAEFHPRKLRGDSATTNEEQRGTIKRVSRFAGHFQREISFSFDLLLTLFICIIIKSEENERVARCATRLFVQLRADIVRRISARGEKIATRRLFSLVNTSACVFYVTFYISKSGLTLKSTLRPSSSQRQGPFL